MTRTTVDLENPVRSIRAASGLSLRELGEKLGQNYQTILNAERRGNRVGLAMLLALAEAGGVALELCAVTHKRLAIR